MIETTSITVSVEVGNLQEGTEWYGQLLMAGPDIEPVEGVLEYKVRSGFWLQISEGGRNSGGAVVRLGVKDLKAECNRLLAAGVPVDEIVQIDGVIAFADFQDPWGNQLSLYQVLDSAG